MNKRIKQLAQQADWDDEFREDFDIQKFAELIVRECAAICINEIADPRDTAEQRCAAKIIKHFGVEL